MMKCGLIASIAVSGAELTSIYKNDYPVEGSCGEETGVEKSFTNPHWFFPMTVGNFHEGKCADIGFSKLKETQVVEMHPVPWVHHNLTFDIYNRDEKSLAEVYTPPTALEAEDPTKCALTCAAEAAAAGVACAATCLKSSDVNKCIGERCDAAQLAFIVACTSRCGDSLGNTDAEMYTQPAVLEAEDSTKCALTCAAEAVGLGMACAATCLKSKDVNKCIGERCDGAQLAFIVACTRKCSGALANPDAEVYTQPAVLEADYPTKCALTCAAESGGLQLAFIAACTRKCSGALGNPDSEVYTQPAVLEADDPTKCALTCAAEAVGLGMACAATCLKSKDVNNCIGERCDGAQLAFIVACTRKCSGALGNPDAEVDNWCQLIPYYAFCAQFDQCKCSSSSCKCHGFVHFDQQEAMDSGFSKGCSCKDAGYTYSSGKITTVFGQQADLYTNVTPAVII